MEHLPSGTVTFLFTDIEGSTKLAQQYPDAMSALLARHHEILHQSIQAQNGYVFQIIGDAFCVAFHTAKDGFSAAIDAQRKLQTENWDGTPIKVRMGLHTGSAEIHENEYRGYLTMAKVQRVMSVAHGGQVLLSNASAELIRNELPSGTSLRDMKEHRLKSLSEPERLWQLVVPGLQNDFPSLETQILHHHNLPERLTTFVGREQALLQVCDLLRQPSIRMVTITGVGGIGKTSLSIQAGLKLLEDFDDGIFFIDLSSLREANLVVPMIAQTFSLHESPEKPLSQILREHLSKKKLLLILDNFEQVLDAASDLNNLLSTAKQLKILVTSRELLRLSAEHHYSLSPLALIENSDAQTRFENEAVRLFVERVQTVKPDFRLSEEQFPIILEICRRLDGLPLAIELSAARCRMFTPQQLLTQLTHRLRFLTGGARDLPQRHQTMRSAIEWSYELLSPDEKLLFQRLAIFVGGCDLDAVQNICGFDGIDIVSGIESLLDKQMINRRDTESDSRFWMFETLREFAAEKLESSEEAFSLHRKHAYYYSSLPANTDKELDNIRAVFSWSLATGEVEPALQLAGDFFFWEKRIAEGLRLITKVLALPGAQNETEERSDALYSAAALSHFHRNYSAAISFADELSQLQHKIGQSGVDMRPKLINASVAVGEGHYEKAYEILFNTRNEGNSHGYAMCTLGMASCALGLHNLNDAKQYAHESRNIFAGLDRKNYLIDCDTVLGYVALEEGDLAMARNSFRQGIQLVMANSVQQKLGVILIGLGGIVLREGKFREAVRWFGISETVITTTGYYARLFPISISNFYIAEAKSHLDPQSFQTAWEEGRSMTMEQAIELALEETT